MVVISGTIGKEAVISYLLECLGPVSTEHRHESNDQSLEQVERSSKRIRLSDPIVLAHITMPLQLSDNSMQVLNECAPSNLNAAHDLEVWWTSDDTFIDYNRLLRSKMTLRTKGTLLAENESLRPYEDLDAFSTVALACSAGSVSCGSLHVSYDATKPNAVGLHITLYVRLPQTTATNARHILPLVNHLYPSDIAPPVRDSVEEFFRHLQPPVSEHKVAACQTPHLMPVLAPFQSQNVEWMLRREGHFFVDDAGTVGPIPPIPDAVPFFWESIRPDGSDAPLYINRVTGQLLSKWDQQLDHAASLTHRGGILADEMGLGKTVCVIALLLLHKLNPQDPTHPNQEANGLMTTSATLIITPSAILRQWESELKLHAPSLRVTTYRGIKASKGRIESAESLSQYDVVLTDYKVLQEEIYHARIPPSRPRRHAAKYPIQRSPLVQLIWFRVIIDEAQMVETTVNLMVEMAMLIPRWYAWGVSGTPIKSNFDDLFGLCRFLSFAPCIQKASQFKTLYHSTSSLFKGLFWDFARQTMRRNIKALLTDQIHIPPQHRRIVKVAFSSIEQHYYQSLWEQCGQSTNFEMLDRRRWIPSDDDPSASTQVFQEVYGKLRTWLLTLRQACVHPTIGSQRKNRLIHQAVRSLDEVLDALIVQAKDDVDTASHQLTNSRLRRGGMWEIQKMWEKAREVYESETIPCVLELIRTAEERVEEARKTAEKEQEDEDHAEATGEETIARPRAGEDYRVQALVQRKARHLSTLHRCYFFLAGIFHEMKQEQKETQYYDKAADVRREILNRAEERVNASRKDMMKPMKPITIRVGQSNQKETIRFTFDILERINALAQALDNQIPHLEKCRAELQLLLCTSLVDYGDGEEATGDEYEQSLLVQEKIDIYHGVYQAMLSDRNFRVNGVWVSGLRLDMKEQEDEAKRTAENMHVDDKPKEPDASADVLKLRAELWGVRSSFAPASEASDNFRLIISHLKDIVSDPGIHHVEKHIIATEIERLNTAASKQREMQERLEAEYRRFTILYNHRVEYYRSLQAISDEVVAWTSDDPEREIQRLLESEERHQKVIKEKSARCRYLENIAKEKEEDKGPRKCLICLSEFMKGLMTFCGHMFCKECAMLWFRSHRRCPQCNTPVMLQECYTIAWDRTEDKSSDEELGHQNVDAMISSDLLKRINDVEATGGLGAKLDSIVRHVKYIVGTTGGKSVIFSQWKDVLDLLAGGLKRNDIGCIQLDGIVRDDRIKQFREDPDTHVILLHARSQSSGLTLVAAQTVFIVEPVLSEALERQAISRVHRIGQTKETTVYWYIIEGTIEERIHAIQCAHRQRRVHLEQGGLGDDDTIADPRVALATRSEGGGERVSDEDLQRCFTSDESWALSY